MQTNYLTPDQVAEMLQLTSYTIREFIKEGKIRAIKIGRSWRIDLSDLEADLQQRKTSKLK